MSSPDSKQFLPQSVFSLPLSFFLIFPFFLALSSPCWPLCHFLHVMLFSFSICGYVCIPLPSVCLVQTLSIAFFLSFFFLYLIFSDFNFGFISKLSKRIYNVSSIPFKPDFLPLKSLKNCFQ